MRVVAMGGAALMQGWSRAAVGISIGSGGRVGASS